MCKILVKVTSEMCKKSTKVTPEMCETVYVKC